MQDVIHRGKNHQHYDDCKADPESDLLSAFRQGSPAYRFDEIEQKMTSIEQRNREQVQQADRDGDHADEVQPRTKSQFGDLSGYAEDTDRAANLVGRLAPNEHVPNVGKGGFDDEPRFVRSELDRIDRAHGLHPDIAGLARPRDPEHSLAAPD